MACENRRELYFYKYQYSKFFRTQFTQANIGLIL